MREFLKGGKYLGDAAWAQDETGYNYREMYQMATTHGDAPANTNLELVLDASSLHLLGTSEAGTGKTFDFAKKRQRIHQLVPSAARGRRNYLQFYCSYGIQYNGKVHVYTLDDLNTTEGQDGLINLCDKYYPTLASIWAAYGKGLADVADAAALREAKACSIVFKRLSRSASSRKNPSLHLQADRKRGKTLIIPHRVRYAARGRN